MTDPAGMITIAYTVWSHERGAGRRIINMVRDLVGPFSDRLITLSPKTLMAKNFHLKNGARLIAENESSFNFEYAL